MQQLQWDEYMMQWDLYTVEGEPYPDTQFIEPMLYVYEGDEVEPYEESPGGLVMAWGDETLPDGSYAAAWMYDYLVDPDLSNATITITAYPPQYGSGGAITQVSFGIMDMSGNVRSWYWNCGPGQPLQWNVANPITINPNIASVSATTPTATAVMDTPGFDVTQVQWFIADENGTVIGGTGSGPAAGRAAGCCLELLVRHHRTPRRFRQLHVRVLRRHRLGHRTE